MKNPASRLAPVLLVLAAGCSDDATVFGGEAGPQPLYVVNSTIFGVDGNAATYFGALPSLAADAAFDTERALEAPGMAKLYAREGLGWFALGGGEEPTVTRFDLAPDGTFLQGAAISFQPRGTAFLGDTAVFVSDTQAYYFDAPNAQLIRWNPRAMSVDSVIDLGVTVQAGFNTIYDIKPLLRPDGMLLFPVAWRNFETDRTFPGTGLVVIDTRSDTLVSFEIDARCQGVTWSASSQDGTLYAATTPYYAVQQRASGAGPAACALRVLPGQLAFDPGYVLDLASLLDGRVAGGLARGNDGELFFRGLEPSVEIGADSDVAGIWSDAVWSWYRWQPASGDVSAIDTLPPSAAGGLTYDLDGKVYATDSAADFSATTLIELTAPGGPAPALSAPGYVYGVARVR